MGNRQELAVPPNLPRTQEDRRAGVIVTAVHDDGPPLWTFHVPGQPTAALREACDRLDVAGSGWKVQTVSTASSIYRDLHGTRANHAVRPLTVSRTTASHRGHRHEDNRPEVSKLGQIGRLDLLAPKREIWA